MSSSPTEAGHLVDVLMPQMGTSMSEGTVIAWLKQPGDDVAADETICEISTDKIDTDCPAPAAGRLVEILVPEGETVEVGAVLARIGADGGPMPTAEAAGATAAPPAAGAAAADRPPAPPEDGRRYSPLVKRIAAEHGIDLGALSGTGVGGRVTKKDVLARLEEGGNGAARPEPPLHSDSPYRPEEAPPAPPDAVRGDLGGVAEPLSRVRQAIGGAMVRSQQTAATCHTVVECDMTAVERRRRELGLTALPLLARATIETLREFPDLNATLEGTTITRYDRVHLGIAVSLGAEGLIVPVVHDAQALSAEGLAAKIKDLARRARSRQLEHDEVQGATFTITNPGQYGAVIATPVIDQPQVGILDLEAIVKRPVVMTDENGEDSIAIRPMTNLILGWDHRAMDGVYAASFLSALRGRVELA